MNWYRWADILIHPARYEAAGIVPSEAAAFGVPTITNDTGGLATTVADGISGIVLPKNSPAEAYVQAIQELVASPERYRSLCETTRLRYERELNWDVAGQRVADILRQVVQDFSLISISHLLTKLDTPVIIFLTQDWPISPSASGAAALIYSHLELLAYSGVDINLLILSEPDNQLGFQEFTLNQPDIWQQIQSWCKEITVIEYRRSSKRLEPLRNVRTAWSKPAGTYAVPTPETQEKFRKIIAKKGTALIWAEHLLPGALAISQELHQPVVYSHHDWSFRIKKMRDGDSSRTLRGKLKFTWRRIVEEDLVRRAAGVVTASASELQPDQTARRQRIDLPANDISTGTNNRLSPVSTSAHRPPGRDGRHCQPDWTGALHGCLLASSIQADAHYSRAVGDWKPERGISSFAG